MVRIVKMAALALFCLSTAAGFQNIPDDREAQVDGVFAAWSKPDTPGAAVAVVMDGKPVLVKGYGSADLEHGTPITPTTLFDAASLAKQFTAAAVLMLEADGKISLQDEVRRFIPEFPDFGRPVTIRHLLYHTSGLRDYGGLVQMSGGRMDDPITSRDVLKLVSRQRELNFPPGTEFAYSNAGYVVLAEIVARAGGQKFRDWTWARLFAPLGMKETFFRDDLTDARVEAIYSYSRTSGGRFEKVPNNGAIPGPGSLFISAADLAHWLAAQQSTASAGDLRTRMATPGTLDDGRPLHYAAGLIIGRYRGLPILHHSGGWAGFRGETVLFPEQKLAVAVLSNNSALDPAPISRQISGIYLEGKFPSPQAAPAPPAIEPAVLDSYVGRYWLDGEQTIQITRREGHLYSQVGGSMAIEIFAESPGLFAYRVADVKIQFHRNPNGDVPKLTFWQGAYAMPAERLPVEIWKPADPAEYCGSYRSEELETTLEVRPGENGLVIPFARRGDLVLVPIADERFAGKDSSTKFRFVRDSDGRIKELRFSMKDAWNVRFARMEEGQSVVDGTWTGAIELMGQKMEFSVHFKTDSGTIQGTMDVPLQGATGLPLKDILLDGSRISFKLETPQAVASFEGVIEGHKISGQFEQQGMAGTFVLTRSDEKTKPEPAQPKDPLPYNEEEVAFHNGDIKFAGTLMLPKKQGKHPTVIMITGSGPQNRYEELFGWKVFQGIADHFTRRGIAVLLYDDRGVGGSGGNVFDVTTEDFATDALAALKYLQSRSDINPRQIGLCGHSEGGIVAPFAAAKSDEVAFIICISGTGVPGKDILLKQTELIARANGEPEEKIKQSVNNIETIISLIKEGRGEEEIKKKIGEIVEIQIAAMTEEQKKGIKDLEAFRASMVDELYRQFGGPWFQFFLKLDPSPILEKVKCPVLLTFGELDLQVPAEWSKEAMVKALERGGNKDFKARIFPKANHLYQAAKTGSPSEYMSLAKEFVPGFLEFMSGWILERVDVVK